MLASTDFNGRQVDPGDPTTVTSASLNWVLNGLTDPGSMSATVFEGGGVSIFDGNDFVSNIFVPGINTGNGNTSWVTSVNLNVQPGSVVSLTDVTMLYYPVNGGQALNVPRRSDFNVSVHDSGGNLVDEVTVADVNAGSGTSVPDGEVVNLVFDSPVALTDPSGYTLRIRGGDFTGIDETGNHTGIDNLSINGTVSAIPEPSALLLCGLGLLVGIRRRRPLA